MGIGEERVKGWISEFGGTEKVRGMARRGLK